MAEVECTNELGNAGTDVDGGRASLRLRDARALQVRLDARR